MRSEIGRAALVAIALASALAAGPPDDAGRAGLSATGTAIDLSRAVGGIPPHRFEPTGLSLLRPYERGKIPVILVHGLWAAPWSWCPMVEALGADPTLAGRYQFWTFGYSTGEPILYSALLLRRALRQAREQFDPDGSDAAFGLMVVVGHSMGGLLAKVMVQDSRSRLWESISDRPVDRALGPPEARKILREAFFYERQPEVRRVVFIATPHRGSRLDRGEITRLVSRLMWHIDPLQEAYKAILASNDPDFFKEPFRSRLSTSVEQLAWEHPRLMAIDALGVDPAVPYHSIIADRRDPPPRGGDRRHRPVRQHPSRRRPLRGPRLGQPSLPGQSQGDRGGPEDPPGAPRAEIARARNDPAPDSEMAIAGWPGRLVVGWRGSDQRRSIGPSALAPRGPTASTLRSACRFNHSSLQRRCGTVHRGRLRLRHLRQIMSSQKPSHET
jgi:hypothetical protein